VKDDRIYLEHIRDCIQRIRNDTIGGHEAFLADRKSQDAVLRNLQTLAESAIRLSAHSKSRQPEVDWRGIAGFRNVLVHNYLGVNMERICVILQTDLPVLAAAVDALLASK